jgi:hypothetical protein
MTTHVPHALSSLTSVARAPRQAPAVPRAAAVALSGLAGLALLAVVTAADPAGYQPAGYRPAPGLSGAVDHCVSPAAVATLEAWPAAVAATADDEYEARGERRPDAHTVSPEFRAFQACRQRRNR